MGQKLQLTLIFSFALNILLIGLFAGYSVRGCRPPPPMPPAMGGKLSPEHQRILEQALGALQDKNQSTAGQIAKSRQEIVSLLSAPQFDAKAFQAKMDELHELHGKMRAQLTQTVTDLAGQFNQEERKSLARFLEQGPPSGGMPPPPPQGGLAPGNFSHPPPGQFPPGPGGGSPPPPL